jgi:hypothetical protein
VLKIYKKLTNKLELYRKNKKQKRKYQVEFCVKLTSIEEYTKALLDTEKTPIVKYELPQTSAQDIGWFHKPLLNPKKSRFYKPKKSCEETLYADALVRSSTVRK